MVPADGSDDSTERGDWRISSEQSGGTGRVRKPVIVEARGRWDSRMVTLYISRTLFLFFFLFFSFLLLPIKTFIASFVFSRDHFFPTTWFNNS